MGEFNIEVANRLSIVESVVDATGEYDYRASIDLATTAGDENLFPAGLAKRCILKDDVTVDTVLTWDMIEVPDVSALLDLCQLQDRRYS